MSAKAAEIETLEEKSKLAVRKLMRQIEDLDSLACNACVADRQNYFQMLQWNAEKLAYKRR